MQLGLLLGQLRLGALALGLLGGDPSALLGDLCLSLAGGRFLSMPVDNLLSPLAQLALSFALSRTLARPRQARQRQTTHNEHYHHDDHNNQYG